MADPCSRLHAGSATELWQALVREGERRAGAALDEQSESWLVFTLMRHLGNAGLAEPAMALEYLQALQRSGRLRSLALQDVGERCLLIAGLYPELAERRSVGLGYYIELGQGVFRQLADETRHAVAELYAGVAREFGRLVRILLELRTLSGQPRGASPLALHAISLGAGLPTHAAAFPGAVLIGEAGRA
jgi:hypothetical protein